MIVSVKGILFRATKYSETSIICDVYTLEFGLRTYIINGIRKKNAKVSPGLLRVMSLVEMEVYHREDKAMNRIKEIKPNYIYQQVPFDVARGAVGLFIAEICQKTIKETEPNPNLFAFLKQTYITLDSTESGIANFPVWFLVHFSCYLGLTPILNNLTELSVFDYSEGKVLGEAHGGHDYFFSPQNTHLLAAFLELNFDVAAQISLNTEERRKFMADILLYLRYHIENFGEVNSIQVLQTIFS
ncbi:DNA repair protein RecO [Aureispira]|nr:DNA repair protein RecO [Aureispira sp.]